MMQTVPTFVSERRSYYPGDVVTLPPITSIARDSRKRASPSIEADERINSNFQTYLSSQNQALKLSPQHDIDGSNGLTTQMFGIEHAKLEPEEGIVPCQSSKLLKLSTGPAVSPGGSSVSSDRVIQGEDSNLPFQYCERCAYIAGKKSLDEFSDHLKDCHLQPSNLPSTKYFTATELTEEMKSRPYTTLYPSKKRKADSDRVPRPQNQYMIFSNYIRTPLMHFFSEVNHAHISQAISKLWKQMTEKERYPFKEESKRCEEIHKKEYPDYRYQPKQKKTAKKSDGVTDYTKPCEPSPQAVSEPSPVEISRHYDINHYVYSNGQPSDGYTFSNALEKNSDKKDIDVIYNENISEPKPEVMYIDDFPQFEPQPIQTTQDDSRAQGIKLPLCGNQEPMFAPDYNNPLPHVVLSAPGTNFNTLLDTLGSHSANPTLGALEAPMNTNFMDFHRQCDVPLSSSAPNDTSSVLVSELKSLSYGPLITNPATTLENAQVNTHSPIQALDSTSALFLEDKTDDGRCFDTEAFDDIDSCNIPFLRFNN